ncbi:RHS repeat-associated core domain-containing protein [Streptomyces sp. NPDC088762]|uniref:RHS repeat-associated core domain-containing protein n=1 Tax=Streptomyces sp. NPDC088762 TaxID=3365891 RepID=UPI00380C3334
MAVTVPDWADTLLDLIGVAWPNVDEDAYRDMADSLREFAEDLLDDGQLANNHIERLLSASRGESIEALNQHWNKVKGQHFKDIADAARTIAGAMDMAAGAVEAMKYAALVQLGYLAAEAGIALSLIPVTAGLSALFGAAAMRATQEVVKRLIKECVEEAVGYIVSAMTEPAVAALEGMAADLVVQLGSMALGFQDGVDLDQTKNAGKDGFKEGVQSGKDALHLASAGGGGAGGGTGLVDLHIDHSEHARAGTSLNSVSVNIHGKTASKLTKARSHHGRTRGRDSIAQAIDPVADKAMAALTKATKAMGDHVGTTLPKAVKHISTGHKKNDDAIHDSFNRLKKRQGDDDGRRHGQGDGPAGDRRRGPGDADRTRPDHTHKAKDEPRRHSIELGRKTCKNDPVDIATGEMTLGQTDLSLAGVLPLVLRRTHLSGYRYGQWFGRSWASTLDERIEPDPVGGGAVWAREDGSLLVYPRLPRPGDDPVMPLEGPRLGILHDGEDQDETTYAVTDPLLGTVRRFTGSPYRLSTAYWLTEITDRNGNGISVSRGSDGCPRAVNHDAGYVAQLQASDDRITALALRTPDGPVTVTTYGYDDHGNLAAVVNSSGLPQRFAYDGDGRMTSWTDRNNSTFTYVYDAEGRVVRTVGPDGFLSSTFAYETEPRVTRYTDSNGATTVFQLNELLQVVAETDPSGYTVRQTWDRYDRLLSRTDGYGRTEAWTWDEQGNLTAVREPDGSVTTAAYDEHGMPTSVTGPDGAVWLREYDEAGNNTALIAPDGTVTRYEHNGRGGIVAVTDALGNTETFRPDLAGLPMARTDALGHTWTFTRDAFGRPTSFTDPLGGTTHLEWSVEGQRLRRTEPDGTELRWTYDGEGNCLEEVDGNGGTTRYEYTHFDLLVARTGPDGARYEFGYDTELRLIEVRNAAGARWSYAYDSAGRMVSETDFDGRTLTYRHDPAGRLLARTNPLGQTVTHHFDDAGRLAAKDVDGRVTTFTYDHAGRLTAARSPQSVTTWEWDRQGRLVAEVVDGRAMRYAYDAAGRCTGRTTPSGVVTAEEYDAAGNRVRMELAGRALSFELAFERDARGREVARTYGRPGDPRIALATAWDPMGRVHEQSLTAQARTQRSRSYTYRGDHLLEAVTEEVSGDTRRYRLDPVGRPLGVDAHGWQESYQYDSEGNQTEASWPDRAPYPESRGARTLDGTRLRSAGALRFAHDAAGRVVERRRKRLSRKPDVWRYTWDAEDRLTSCTTPDGVLWTYAYDAFARRTAKHRHDTDGTIVESTVFSWDGGRIAEQTHSATGTTLTWEYDGYRPLAQAETRRAGTSAQSADAAEITNAATQDAFDARFFAIVTDLIGTPTELVGEDGGIAWYSRATQWGTTTWNRDATAYTPLRFPGQYADPETGLHYNHFRHYDPEAGRYITPDPLGLEPDPNPVGYVDNPATMCDPMGLAPCMQSLEDMATQINNLKPEGKARSLQTVAVIHAQTPKGPVTFVAGTSKSKLDAAQIALAKSLGLVPLPSSEYMKVPKGDKGGHAEQNILAFLSRMNGDQAKPTWLPSHGAASNVVCNKFCAPVIRGSGGAMYGLLHPHTQGTQQKQFYWPSRHKPV